MDENQVTKFWMVLRDGSTYTSYRHDTRWSAIQEAQRLSLENPGYKFFVLELTNAFFEPVREPQELEVVFDDIPF